MSTDSTPPAKQADLVVNGLSIAIPVVVMLLLSIRQKFPLGDWTHYLPHAIGAINTLTSLCLIAGLVMIRNRNIQAHRVAMTAAFSLGGLFLICYVTYHLSNPSTPYGGAGVWRILYYGILLSHILLSLVVLPLVLRAILFAWTGQFERHRRIAKWAFPVWLYVSVTGVVVYLMIAPYYQHP
jgi:putative membrane protein